MEGSTMGYLQPTDYENYGLPQDTTDDWITVASAMIDSYCRRPSLNPTQYTERLRLVTGSQTVRLSYLPLATVPPATSPLVSVSGRYARPRRGELLDPAFEQVAWVFGLPGTWNDLDPTTVDYVPNTGELIFSTNILGLAFNEVSVTYMAGLTSIGDDVLTACALLVKNAQNTPGLNVKSNKLDTMRVDYFSNDLLDPRVQSLLRPYVASRLG
jgi:hypothetical protein